MVAPTVFKQRFPQDADSQKMKDIVANQKEVTAQEMELNRVQKDLEETVTLGDDRLLQMSQLFKPYSPYTYLKQTFCSALHQNKVYKLEETERQNKDSKSPQDAVKLYMCLKKHGEIDYEYTCTASSLKKGKIKLALGILRQKYGLDKKWKELVREMTQAVLDAREKRGAGEKPFL